MTVSPPARPGEPSRLLRDFLWRATPPPRHETQLILHALGPGQTVPHSEGGPVAAGSIPLMGPGSSRAEQRGMGLSGAGYKLFLLIISGAQ